MDDQETLVLVLRKPVTIAGKTVDSIKLREVTAGELEAASRAASPVGVLMNLISIVAGVSPAVPQAMGSRDLAAADAYFKTFTVPPPELGDGDDFIDELTITLRKQVTIGKGDAQVTHDKLELAEPNGAQKDKASREPNDVRAAITLISSVAKVPRLVVERLCQRDFEEACNFLVSCNVAGQTIGATSPQS